MSDWPKLENEAQAVFLDSGITATADQAPEPVAWMDVVGWQNGEHAQDCLAHKPLDNWQALYLASPSESDIRASERERCAQLCETIDRSDPSDDATALACADAIRELGDE